jgi:hypothetical protein
MVPGLIYSDTWHPQSIPEHHRNTDELLTSDSRAQHCSLGANVLNKSIGHIPSWEDEKSCNWSEIPHFLRKPSAKCRVHNSPSLGTNLGQVISRLRSSEIFRNVTRCFATECRFHLKGSRCARRILGHYQINTRRPFSKNCWSVKLTCACNVEVEEAWS